ncbi:MAG TPA: hypothetical protein VGF67_33625 [Ktedonobacteraceae bacterium]
MNFQSLRNALRPRSRAWVVGLSLALSLFVVAGLLVTPRYAVVHASASSSGATVTAKIEPQAAINDTDIDVSVTWSCVLPQGAPPSVFGITLQLSQQIGGATISSSGQYQDPHPVCDGNDNLVQVAVPSPPGGQPFQAGTALAFSASATLFYYTDSTMYDLVPLSVSLRDQAITIKAFLSISLDTNTKPSTVNAGTTIYYRIVVNNLSSGWANKVTVTDLLPTDAGLNWTILLENPSNSWSITNGVLSLAPIKLPPARSGIGFAGVIIMSPTTPDTCGTVTNTATATSNNAGTLSAGPVPITVTCS